MEDNPDRKSGKWNLLAKYQQSYKGLKTPIKNKILAGTRFFA
jgi:hypothetical protein